MARKQTKRSPEDFETSMKRLEEIVEQLEDGALPLDKAIGLFEEGKKMGKACGKRLTEIEKRVLKIIDDGSKDGQMEPFDPEEEAD